MTTYDFFNSSLLNNDNDNEHNKSNERNEYIKNIIKEWSVTEIKLNKSIYININGRTLKITCVKKIENNYIFSATIDKKQIILPVDFTCIKNLYVVEKENIKILIKKNKYSSPTKHFILYKHEIKLTRYFICDKYLRTIDEDSQYIGNELNNENMVVKIVPFCWILPHFFSIFKPRYVEQNVKKHVEIHVKKHVEKHVETPVEKHVEIPVKQNDDNYHKGILIEGMMRITSINMQQNDNEGKLIIDFLLSQIFLCIGIF